ncbi:MAG TPA: NAD(P)/FAD-dependent oxidoreductase [Pseudomonadales bacterium]|nr:NAD(P)/FAD-dependent oxidoreductase [Candidatus Manganitrophaceae bacterium]HIL95113.1 NAD(P)/FAD-dependent oxidoreductase [Pseudomonadales bacterium]
MTSETESSSKLDLGFDPDELRQKYSMEKVKRLRSDGNEQYVEVRGDFVHYIDDPYLKSKVEREPLTDEIDIVIIGGGFGGLLAAVRLRDAGVKNFRIIEKGGDFGGTWYWNRYPGAACDIESYIYLPLLEEIGYMPKKKYIDGADILEYSQMIARKFDLYDDVCFQTEVKEIHWDEATGRWTITTDKGDAMKARFVAMSNGPLNRPKLPGIPGIESYKGHTFHTARWDYDYTGGDANGGLTDLKDKRVGILGTGATAVQCVSHLAEGAKQLYVFQRTPSSIDERNDYTTDTDWASSLKPGWQQERMDNFNILTTGGIAEKDLVNDGWTEIIRNLLVLIKDEKTPDMAKQAMTEKMELADFQKMEQIRGRVDSIVKDPETAELLKPYYRQFCKRPCFHDEYLPTFNRPNVELVDTKGMGVDKITENGVVVDGKEYEVDCLIFATGFEVGTGYARRSGCEMYGRDGVSLTEKWSEGARTFHGMQVNGFPNCFMMGHIQTGFTANYPHGLNEQSKHIAYIIKHCMEGNHRVVEASAEAEEAWVQTIIGLARSNEKFLADCTPGYYNNEGKPQARALQDTNYGAGSEAFFKLIKTWRDEGTLEGLDVS